MGNQHTEHKYSITELRLLAKTCKNLKQFKTEGYYRAAEIQDCSIEFLKYFEYVKEYNKTDENIELSLRIETELPKYSTITEFREHHPKLYYHIHTKNMDKYLNYYIPQKYSTHQLICKKILETILNDSCIYNDRKILKGKELDIFFPKYNIACEYNGYYWHKSTNSKRKDKIKDVECSKLGIYLIRVCEPSLNSYNNFESSIISIKTQLIKYIDNINKRAMIKLQESDIMNISISRDELLEEIYNKNLIDKIVNTYTNYSDVKNNHNSLYQYLTRNNMLHVLDPIKSRDHRHMNEDQYFNMCILTFKTYNELVKTKSIYQVARKKGFLPKIKHYYSK